MITEDDLRRLPPDQLLAVFNEQCARAASVVESARHALARASRMHRLAVDTRCDIQANTLADERVDLAETLREAEAREREWCRRRDIVAAACQAWKRESSSSPD